MRGLTRSSAAVLAAALLFSAGVLAARGNKDGPVAVSRGEAAVSAAETEQGSGLIDINSAGAEELDLLRAASKMNDAVMELCSVRFG